MSIEIVKIERDGGGFSIWIDEEQEFSSPEWLELLGPIGIGKSNRVHESFGPAVFIDDITTSDGVLSLHQQFDEFSGSSIYSGSSALMKRVFKIMLESGLYHAR
jgi:hypothetical protein